MAEFPQTGTILNSQTHTLLSTQIIIKVGAIAVGAIQSFTARQTRANRAIPEVGTDGIIERVPNRATEVTLSVRRVAFDRLRMTEAFGRGFINIQAQRIPFDIEVHENFKEESGQVYIYHNCWFTSLNTPYNADDYVVVEDAEIAAEFVSSLFPVDGGERGIPFQVDPIEASSDIGQRRGSLDSAGLIDAAFNE
ncbi:MAG: hypothetical protein R3321_10770 [Nitrososphaeraceae archaeon]|nr:hypothetical protein [Nitrososphaeraceae archaeon]